MDLNKLNSRDTSVLTKYVEKKFKTFKGFTYSKSTRVKKCEQYYMAASEANRDLVQDIYQAIFKEMLDIHAAADRADKENAKKKPEKIKIEAGAWLDMQTRKSDGIDDMLRQLYHWRDTGEYQGGESFFSNLREMVENFDSTILNTTEFQTEFSAQCRASISQEVTVSPREIKAQYDLMVGFTQNAAMRFTAASTNWGTVSAKLEESFKAGIWSNGTAQAKLSRLGLTAEVQAAIAIGAQLEVTGDLRWTKGRAGLALSGEGKVMAGAQASGKATLSASALKGLEASIKAGAFAGFSAEVKGSFSFSYDDKVVAEASASAAIKFGVGAEFEASISAPIFGPTKIKFGGGVTLGIGTEVNTDIQIDFNQAQLAGSEAFKRMVYWRTMARGYQMTLMNSDARNLFYLNKTIRRMEAERVDTSETITTYNRVPEEKRSLLMAVN